MLPLQPTLSWLMPALPINALQDPLWCYEKVHNCLYTTELSFRMFSWSWNSLVKKNLWASWKVSQSCSDLTGATWQAPDQCTSCCVAALLNNFLSSSSFPAVPSVFKRPGCRRAVECVYHQTASLPPLPFSHPLSVSFRRTSLKKSQMSQGSSLQATDEPMCCQLGHGPVRPETPEFCCWVCLTWW